ncbi:MAG: hypothetical protein COA96_05080 [SAR86 cluster bacterium]|uniref:Uncharacterized protein n=1 Tax=SAR86 cluster bacterium TaxID=2030880 RepID=A0A2A5B4B9_9GAMM|nr:MAG: hypothetical protein COA96_05080 [SAR86 cluster bacterium]
MPLSTSSFKRREPGQDLVKLLIAGLLAGLLLVVASENILRALGARASTRETATLWAEHRATASAIDIEKIIIIGSSRAQLGVDIEELENLSGTRVVQLAIDGSPYSAILESLANDPAVTGTIIISTTLDRLQPSDVTGRAEQWLEEFEIEFQDASFLHLENNLVAGLQSISALYANVIPLTRIARSIVGFDDFPTTFVSTQRNRERNADYNLAPYPDVYVTRVMSTLDLTLEQESFVDIDAFDAEVILAAREDATRNSRQLPNLSFINTQLTKLQARSVNVIFVQFPMSGAVAAINDIRYPKAMWDVATQQLNANVIDYRDYPALQYELVDGSHLDVRQKTEFTRNLYRIINQLAP